MAWIQMTHTSRILDRHCGLEVILPEKTVYHHGGRQQIWDGKTELPVLYLLHGLGDDHTVWHRMTALERMLYGRPMAVVMPDACRSFYCDQAYGRDYLRYIAEEVPQVVQEYFRVSPKRSENFIAGVSMGGYGAMKIGLLYSEKFSKVATFSGLLDMGQLPNLMDKVSAIDDEAALYRLRFDDPESYTVMCDMKANFGDTETMLNDRNNPVEILKSKVREGATLPDLLITMGKEDLLYESNVTFRKQLDALGIPYRYMEDQGEHVWRFWDTKMLEQVLDWLPVKNYVDF